MSLLFKDRNKGASDRGKVPTLTVAIMWIVTNFRQLVASLGELSRTPIPTAMTVAVLGLSVTLPTTLYVLVHNLERVSANWEGASEISLFLRTDRSVGDAQQLIKRLRTWPEIDNITFVSADQAMEEFKTLSGFGDAVEYLDKNPLPHVVLVYPNERNASPTAAAVLLEKLQKQREVELGKLDIEWLQRLHAIVAIAGDLAFIIAALLFVSVVLIIGNTIRLNIFNKRNEILVMKLVGATDGFIQRPFLYTGFWYGFLGGILAWIAVGLLLWWMSSSIAHIAELYQQDFELHGLTFGTLLTMLLLSVGLGLVGSFVSVQRYVNEIEPE